jgi:hypothetical protein
LGIPSEFDQIEAADLVCDPNSNLAQMKAKRDETQIELKLFTSLKLFYKEKELDLTEVLKQIRLKKHGNQHHDFTSWEQAYWQLLHIIFTCFYLEYSQNKFLTKYF